MTQKYDAAHFVDADLNPVGGAVGAPGLQLRWQNGPLTTTTEITDIGKIEKENEPNGVLPSTVIDVVRNRLHFLMQTSAASEGKGNAIVHLEEAIKCLEEDDDC